jgi:hypothetical protein
LTCNASTSLFNQNPMILICNRLFNRIHRYHARTNQTLSRSSPLWEKEKQKVKVFPTRTVFSFPAMSSCLFCHGACRKGWLRPLPSAIFPYRSPSCSLLDAHHWSWPHLYGAARIRPATVPLVLSHGSQSHTSASIHVLPIRLHMALGVDIVSVARFLRCPLLHRLPSRTNIPQSPFAPLPFRFSKPVISNRLLVNKLSAV